MRGRAIFSSGTRTGIYLLIIEMMLLGGAFRLIPIVRSNFPLNDGGLFFTMTEDLVKNHFQLPVYTSYNHKNIAFSYPPLPFFLAGSISSLLKIELVSIFRFLPLLFSILAIPAFYSLSNELLRTESQRIYATLAFTVASPSFEWMIMGGGLTRAPAYFFSILALKYFVRQIRTQKRYDLLPTVFFSGLTGYFHLEILWMTTCLMLVTTLVMSRHKKSLISIIYTVVGICILLSPYLFFVMINHGIQPFISAFSAGEFVWHKSIAKLLLDTITGEYLFTPIAVLGLFGFLYNIYKKEYLLPAWIIFTTFLNPRSLERTLIIPITLLVGITMTRIIIPGILSRFQEWFQEDTDAEKHFVDPLMRDLMPTKIIALVIVYMFIRSAMTGQIFVYGLNVTLNSLSAHDQKAMTWISQHTQTESNYLVVTPLSNWEVNEVAEWFPTLSKRESVITVQGTEWLPNDAFGEHQKLYNDMILCPLSGLQCILEVSNRYQISYSHIYLSGNLQQFNVQFPLPIETELRNSSEYTLIYDQGSVLVFSKNPE